MLSFECCCRRIHCHCPHQFEAPHKISQLDNVEAVLELCRSPISYFNNSIKRYVSLVSIFDYSIFTLPVVVIMFLVESRKSMLSSQEHCRLDVIIE